MKKPTMQTSEEFLCLGLPWGDQEFPFLSALLRSVGSLPGEIAFALGGSFASKSAVPLSDLDFFLYVARLDAHTQAELLRSNLGLHPAVITACPVHYYNSFGYRCSWTLYEQPVSLVEVFVTSTLDLKANVMAKWNHLIIDRSSAYREHLSASQALCDDSSNDILELAFHDLLASAQKTRKEINSCSFIQAANRFYKFRMACLSILVFAETGILHHPLVGEKQIKSLTPSVVEVLLRSYRLESLEDLDSHFKFIIDLLLKGILAISQREQISQRRATLLIEQLREYAKADPRMNSLSSNSIVLGH